MPPLENKEPEQFDLGLFFELSPDFLCIAGFDGYFKKVNPALIKTLGYTEEELFAKPINDFIYAADKDVTNKQRESIKNGSTLLNFENRYVTKNGDLVWLAWTSVPLQKQKLVYAIAKNITHKKRQEEDRNTILESLIKVNQDLKQLTYTTSHDLRSPVNNLLSIFGILNTSKIQDEETLQFISVLKTATENLKKTLNNYVDILTSKEATYVKTEQINITDCLNEVLVSIRSLITETNTTIEINAKLFNSIHFNASFLKSIFLNLITNSIKYAKPNCAPVIRIETQIENEQLQIIFTDNGLGFDFEKVKHKIFGFQQKFQQHIDSKGIGLFLVYNHMNRLGGSITIDSKLNEGTKFTLTFKN